MLNKYITMKRRQLINQQTRKYVKPAIAAVHGIQHFGGPCNLATFVIDFYVIIRRFSPHILAFATASKLTMWK